MCNAILEDGVVWFSGFRFVVLKSLPAFGEKLVAPADIEEHFGIFTVTSRSRLGDLGVHRTFTAKLFCPPLVIDDESIDDRFYERTKSAALGISLAEVAADKLQGKLLEHLVGRILVSQRRKRIPPHGLAVASEQPLLG